MVKTCSKCGLTKELSEFSNRQSHCKVCKAKASREFYAANSVAYRASNLRRIERNTARVRELKETTPCADCGVLYPYYVMDFDHVRGAKVTTLSHMVAHGWSWKKIAAEIAKCDLVCSNCHRIRTHVRREATH